MSRQSCPTIYLYDRWYHSSMQAAWADGFPAKSPIGTDPVEWKASARRLAKVLDCRIRCGLAKTNTGHVVKAVANDGFPLGITDPIERDAWLRQRADADGG